MSKILKQTGFKIKAWGNTIDHKKYEIMFPWCVGVFLYFFSSELRLVQGIRLNSLKQNKALCPALVPKRPKKALFFLILCEKE